MLQLLTGYIHIWLIQRGRPGLIQDISARPSAPELPRRLAEAFVVAALQFSLSGVLLSLVVLFLEQTPKIPFYANLSQSLCSGELDLREMNICRK